MKVYVLSVSQMGQSGATDIRMLGVYVSMANAMAAGIAWSKQVSLMGDDPLNWSTLSGVNEYSVSSQFLRDDAICVLSIHSFKLESVGLK